MENILRECAERLFTAANGLSSSSTSSSAQQTSVVNVQSQEQSSTTTTAPSRPSVAPSVLEEHRRIFGYRPPVGAVRRPLQGSGATKGRGRPYFVPKNTFTRAFVCLANTDQVSAPTASERIRLTMAGLGEAKIVFNKDGNAQHVHGKILETFPALSDAGGYDILRMNEGSTRQLLEIPCPSKWFTVQYLKSALGQAKGFLRPIQKNLDLEVQATDASTNDAPKVNCVKCGEQVIITQVRIHQRNCNIAQEQPDVASNSNVSDTNVASDGNNGSIHSLQIPSHVGFDHCSSEASKSLTELNVLFPQESEESIREVLMESGGDAGLAASRLVQWDCSPDTSSGASNTKDDFGEDDMDLLQSPFNVETNSVDSAVRYRRHVLKPDGPPLRIYINRLQEEFASDVLTIYKKPNSGLCSSLRVKFENERGVGEGPVREFFSLLIGMVQNGFPLEESQLTLVFEGETDHKVPVPNALLCGGGFFKSAGRMMAHSFLHGGPPIYGISPAVVDYWCSHSIDSLTIEDVPDYELREALIELTSLDKDQEATGDLLEFLRPYRDEAGILQVPLSGEKRHIALQRILVYNVIEKRRNELNDLVSGMNELSLVNYLKSHRQMAKAVFPREAESVVDPKDVKARIVLDSPVHSQGETLKGFLCQFVDDISHENEAGAGVKDLLAFWTGWEILPPTGQNLYVCVDDGKSPSSLPESTACFHKLSLSSQQTEYAALKALLLKALKYGSRGYTSL